MLRIEAKETILYLEILNLKCIQIYDIFGGAIKNFSIFHATYTRIMRIR